MPPFVQRPPVALVMTPSLCLPPLLVVTVPLAASTGSLHAARRQLGRLQIAGRPVDDGTLQEILDREGVSPDPPEKGKTPLG